MNNENLNNNVNSSQQPSVQPMNMGATPSVPQQPVQPSVQPMNMGATPSAPQQPVQPSVQPMNMGTTLSAPQQPVQPSVQPMNMGATPSVPQQPMNPNNKSNKLLYIIVALLVIAAVAVACIFFLGGNDEKEDKKGVNEYEETGKNNIDNDATNKPNNNPNIKDETDNDINDDSSYIYSGFKFKKTVGYDYEEDGGMLTISDDKIAVALRIENVSFYTAKTNVEQLKNSMRDGGYIVGEHFNQYISGNEVISFEISKDGITGIYFISEADYGYTMEAIVMNNLFIPSTNDVETAVNIIGDVTYVGNYSGYSSQFGLDINNLF